MAVFAEEKHLAPDLLLLTPSVATVLASYNCSAACTHCCFDSHPGIKQRLTLGEIKRFIAECSTFETLRLIVFSGGECFLLGRDLNRAIEHATSLGLQTRCVSNGYWAATPKRALSRLQGLRDAGLKELNISTGDFHQEYVPSDRVVNATEAAVMLGMSMVIVVEVKQERTVSANQLYKDPRIAALGDKVKIIESPWMPSSHLETIAQQPGRLVNRANVHRRTGCDSVFSTVVATPRPGRVGICCGLSRERISELNVSWDADESLREAFGRCASDFMKIWLFVEGPEHILAWAAEKDPHIDWENRYAHRCHACLAVFHDPRVVSAIRTHYEERVEDILVRYALMCRSQENVLRRTWQSA
ncbi:MAG: radical SAM protein [Solirubrobacteraceae bacterium]